MPQKKHATGWVVGREVDVVSIPILWVTTLQHKAEGKGGVRGRGAGQTEILEHDNTYM